MRLDIIWASTSLFNRHSIHVWEVKTDTRLVFKGFIDSCLVRSQQWNYVEYIIKGTETDNSQVTCKIVHLPNSASFEFDNEDSSPESNFTDKLISNGRKAQPAWKSRKSSSASPRSCAMTFKNGASPLFHYSTSIKSHMYVEVHFEPVESTDHRVVACCLRRIFHQSHVLRWGLHGA